MAMVGFAVVLPALGFPAMNLPAIVFRLNVRLSVQLNRAAYLILLSWRKLQERSQQV
jgi:hypothetical protein